MYARSTALSTSVHVSEAKEWWSARESDAQMRLLLGSILVFNLFDAVATIFWVHALLAVEANPLMDHLLQYSPVLFVAVKMLLVSLGASLLWQKRSYLMTVLATWLLWGIYVMLTLYHLAAMTAILLS